MTTNNPPTTTTTTPSRPGRAELLNAVLVAAWVFLATFLAGLISNGFDLFDTTVASLAGEAAIAAGLGLLGWEIYAHRRAPARPPGVYVKDTPP